VIPQALTSGGGGGGGTGALLWVVSWAAPGWSVRDLIEGIGRQRRGKHARAAVVSRVNPARSTFVHGALLSLPTALVPLAGPT